MVSDIFQLHPSPVDLYSHDTIVSVKGQRGPCHRFVLFERLNDGYVNFMLSAVNSGALDYTFDLEARYKDQRRATVVHFDLSLRFDLCQHVRNQLGRS